MTYDPTLLDPPFAVLSPDLQARFWTRLQLMRNEYLSGALSKAVAGMDIATIDEELSCLLSPERRRAFAAYGLREETFYPVPCVLKAKPMLLGYYRLLYGISQKEFYSKGPFGRFKLMEDRDRLSPTTERLLPNLCQSLVETCWQLFSTVQPVSATTIHELQLLTLGPQFRGTENNTIGQGAIKILFDFIRDLISIHVTASSEQVIIIKNAAARTVQIAFASDPDIAIMEALPSMAVPSVSIEVKGGADVSNIHNRIGEAEKSHQKAKAAGFTQCWTILKARIDPEVARRESPTTTHWFNLDEIQDQGHPCHAQFRDLLYHSIGIA